MKRRDLLKAVLAAPVAAGAAALTGVETAPPESPLEPKFRRIAMTGVSLRDKNLSNRWGDWSAARETLDLQLRMTGVPGFEAATAEAERLVRDAEQRRLEHDGFVFGPLSEEDERYAQGLVAEGR